MRRAVRDGKGADVVPLVARIKPQRAIEAGIIEDGSGIMLAIENANQSVVYRMTADQAEAFCVDLMGFIHELRNGGRIG